MPKRSRTVWDTSQPLTLERIFSPGTLEGMNDSLELVFTVVQGVSVVEIISIFIKGCLDGKLDGTPEGKVAQIQALTGQLASPHVSGNWEWL